MPRLTVSQISLYYGHELFAKLNGKEGCDCDDCNAIRFEMYRLFWKDVVKKTAKFK